MAATPPTFRFAPSPNGYLHRGHAFSALVNHHLATRLQGRMLLRIEDIDHGRARPEFEQQIHDDLAFLGIRYEEPVLRQSEELDIYAFHLDTLEELGVLYPSFASRRDILQHPLTARMPKNPDGAPIYPGIDRDLDPRERARRLQMGWPYALRLDMQKALDVAREKVSEIAFAAWTPGRGVEQVVVDPSVWGDVVLARKELMTSYTLAVVVDDARQGVTHVVRGMDLYHATSLQRLLQILLDLPEPVYYHHDLVLDDSGRKLSKSDGAESLKALREAGITPQDLLLQLPPLPLE